jgi:3-hydroxyacyl-[acyl-carrier-protein] dehydratase
MSEIIADIEEIIDMLPHRYPILLVDRVVEYSAEEKRMVSLKNVTFNEPIFNGHFPNKPIMPGVLIVEAMAQTSALYTVKTLGDEARGKLVYFMSIEGAKFRKPVTPGDSLYITVEALQSRGNVWKFKCEGAVEGKKVAEAVVCAMIVDGN